MWRRPMQPLRQNGPQEIKVSWAKTDSCFTRGSRSNKKAYNKSGNGSQQSPTHARRQLITPPGGIPTSKSAEESDNGCSATKRGPGMAHKHQIMKKTPQTAENERTNRKNTCISFIFTQQNQFEPVEKPGYHLYEQYMSGTNKRPFFFFFVFFL